MGVQSKDEVLGEASIGRNNNFMENLKKCSKMSRRIIPGTLGQL